MILGSCTCPCTGTLFTPTPALLTSAGSARALGSTSTSGGLKGASGTRSTSRPSDRYLTFECKDARTHTLLSLS